MDNKQWILNSFPKGDIKDSDLILKQSSIREIEESEILIRNIYLSLDPANRGWMSGQASYVDAMQIGDVMRGGTIGIVEKSNNEKISVGDYVSLMGGWQEYLISNGKGVQVIPKNTGLELSSFMSIMGMTGMTAYFGLLDITNPQPGETLVVSAAAGAVGSIVCQIGKIKGCRVIGISGSDEKCEWLKNDLNIDGVINYKKENVRAKLKELCPNGIDIYFENVGGKITEAVLTRMNIKGRIALCGLISGYNSETVLPGPAWGNLLIKRIKLQGFIVFDYQKRAMEAFQDLGKWIAEGKIKYKNDIIPGLENAVSAIKTLFSGENKGKLIIKVSEEK
tara:strand:+ start:5619 stop:6626 length:1008 start_codon:yes stop_codon:yes gene_type:complete